MAKIAISPYIVQCKVHVDCKTRAKITTWDCGCVEVTYIEEGFGGYNRPCDDFAGMARKYEHEHDQESVLVEMRENLRKQHERILAMNPNWQPRPVYRGVRGGCRTKDSENPSSVRPISINDYVEIVQPR